MTVIVDASVAFKWFVTKERLSIGNFIIEFWTAVVRSRFNCSGGVQRWMARMAKRRNHRRATSGYQLEDW